MHYLARGSNPHCAELPCAFEGVLDFVRVAQHEIGDDHHVLHLSMGHAESRGTRLIQRLTTVEVNANHQVIIV